MRRVAALGMLAATALGGWASATAAAASPSGVAGCARRAEATGSRAIPPAADLIANALWVGTPLLGATTLERQPGRDIAVKNPVSLRARHRATIRVAKAQARHAGLLYTTGTQDAMRVPDADRSVRFSACRADQKRFSDAGVVGPFTFWAGAIMVDAPRCVRLELVVDGRRQRDVRVPVGRRCPAAKPSRAAAAAAPG